MITDIHLQQFRSYQDESFELSPGVNIIVGPNASGKTNLLEALLMVTIGKSYRAKDNELIRFAKNWARLEAHTQNNTRVVKLENDKLATQKSFKINGQNFRRLSLQKTLPTIIFEPNNLLMLSGAPELRRQYLDNLLEQTLLGFSGLHRHYKRALAQRNTLLKNGRGTTGQQLFAWDVRLSELGSQIAGARQKLVEKIDNNAQKIYQDLANNKNKIKFVYQTSIDIDNYATDLLRKLESSAIHDFERGFTSYGPHRDDLQIYINGHSAIETASRGEVRTLLLVCKIIETELVEKDRGVKPILLLDDVFGELDGARRQALTKFLRPYQTFITTTDADVVVQHFTESAAIIPLQKK